MTPQNSETLHYRLTPPAVWQPLLEEALRPLDEQQAAAATALLFALNDRHVGMTPALMVDALPWLLEHRNSGTRGGTTGMLLGRLLRDLRGGNDAADPGGVGFLPSIRPLYTLWRILSPAVQLACTEMGEVCLLCSDGAEAEVSKQEYVDYCARLERTLAALAADSERHTLFWKVRALALSGIFKPRPDESSPLPQADPIAAALLLRIRPAGLRQDDERRRTERFTLQRLRKDARRREEGFDGVKLTRNPDDLQEMLLTEYVYPAVIKAERFTDSGFLALEREPHRTRLRDLLMVAYLPPPFQGTLAADLLRSCWFEFVWRASLLLHQSGLTRSEFRWVESDPMSAPRTNVLELYRLAGMHLAGDFHSERARARFLESSGWLPTFLDERAMGGGPGAPLTNQPAAARPIFFEGWARRSEREARLQLDAMQHWLLAAWHGQREARTRDQNREADPLGLGGGVLRADEFAHTIHLLLYPGEQTDLLSAGATAHRNAIAARLRRRRTFSGAVHLCCAPMTLNDQSKWLYSPNERPQDLRAPIAQEDTVQAVVGRVVKTWVRQFMAEVRRA